MSFKTEALAGIEPIRVRRIEVWACRAPLEKPVETSFGAMHDRPAVFVRLEDGDGAFGFGEIWCNFPGCGAEHRARLVAEELAPLVFGSVQQHPSELFQRLQDTVHIRILQAGEPGPYQQAIAGLDMALWDLFARKAGVAVRQALVPSPCDDIPVYASGIHIMKAPEQLDAARAKGYRAFKVKVGFDLARDIDRLKELDKDMRQDERLFADANQAWDFETACRFMEGAAETGLGWIEEPLPADAPESDWRALASSSAIPLAGGENIAGFDAFRAAISAGALSYIQPDIAKWGGFTGCFEVARHTLSAEKVYCPHYLGGGIGLRASAELLAAVGGSGLLEIDFNDNPMRQQMWNPAPEAGHIVLDTVSGLGVEELPPAISKLSSWYCDARPGPL